MFYSESLNTIATNSTYLDTQNVFSGQYWDEFGITGHLVPHNAEVLMLGLAGGGGIRPIMAANKNIHVTSVDIDPMAVTQCEQYFTENFPRISFTTMVSDAKQTLADTKTTFDCIWLDLYTENSYSLLYFDDEFYSLVQKRLSPNGVLLCNAYGLGNQFDPLSQGGVQSRLGIKLASRFEFVAAIPYRRNLTFLCSSKPPQIEKSYSHSDLSLRDSQTFQTLKLRLLSLEPIRYLKSPAEKLKFEELLFASLDAQMRELWPTIVPELQRCGYKASAAREILDVIQDPIAGSRVLTNALAKHSMLLSCIPILSASEVHLRELDIEWLFSWFFGNAIGLRQINPDIYRTIWLTQLWSLVLHPSKRFERYAQILFQVIKDELK